MFDLLQCKKNAFTAGSLLAMDYINISISEQTNFGIKEKKIAKFFTQKLK